MRAERRLSRRRAASFDGRPAGHDRGLCYLRWWEKIDADGRADRTDQVPSEPYDAARQGNEHYRRHVSEPKLRWLTAGLATRSGSQALTPPASTIAGYGVHPSNHVDCGKAAAA